MNTTSVFCIATSRRQADHLVDHLKTESFANTHISILLPDRQSARHSGPKMNSSDPQDAAPRTATGGIIGGALGWIAGIETLSIPGVGPFIAAGPIVAAVNGVTKGAAGDGIAGGLVGLGISRIDADRLAARLKDGHIFIAVHLEDLGDIARAKDIFNQAGAQDICATGEAFKSSDCRATERSVHPVHAATVRQPVSNLVPS